MPQLHRLSDVCTGHGPCPPRPTVAGSEDVLTNGLNSQRIGDPYSSHCSHDGECAAGSPDVFVNSISVVRVGDAVSCGGSAGVGSPNVFVNN